MAKLLLVDQHKTTHEIDTDDYPILHRGGKGHKLVKGPVRLGAYIDLQLLPGQTITVRCPACAGTREILGEGVVSVPGRQQRVWVTCKGCR